MQMYKKRGCLQRVYPLFSAGIVEIYFSLVKMSLEK